MYKDKVQKMCVNVTCSWGWWLWSQCQWWSLPCWWGQLQLGRNCLGVSETVCVQGGRGQPQSFLHTSGGVQVLEGWKFGASHLLSRANDMLQPALVLSSDSSVPDDLRTTSWSWCSAPSWGPGIWWSQGGRRTLQCQRGSHTWWL